MSYTRKNFFIFLICSITLLSLNACSRNDSSSKAKNIIDQFTNSTLYPLDFKDYYSRIVKIDKEPKKIISGAPNITEIIYALGKKDILVGRTDFCNYPADVNSIQSIGGIQNPNIEKIIELKPDVIIASSLFAKETVEKLEALNIKVVIIHKDDSLEGTYDIIKQIGQIVNANEKALELVSSMQKKISYITEKTKSKYIPSVYYVISYGKDGDFTAGKNTFISKMIDMAGGKNAADDTEGWAYSMEKLIEKNPDILICSKYGDAKLGIKNTNGYKNLNAVKNNKLYEIDPDLLNRQGPRISDGLEALAKIIHPEMFK